MEPKRVESYNQIKMCMCVDIYGGYIWWLILILLCSLKAYLSFETWKHLLENRGYLIHLSFSSLFLGGHLSTHYFKYLGHLSIFSHLSFFLLFFMNIFCIAHVSFLQKKHWERYQQELWSIYFEWMENLLNMFLCSLPV